MDLQLTNKRLYQHLIILVRFAGIKGSAWGVFKPIQWPHLEWECFLWRISNSCLKNWSCAEIVRMDNFKLNRVQISFCKFDKCASNWWGLDLKAYVASFCRVRLSCRICLWPFLARIGQYGPYWQCWCRCSQNLDLTSLLNCNDVSTSDIWPPCSNGLTSRWNNQVGRVVNK